jgi:N-acetyl sugar amidotransferase
MDNIQTKIEFDSDGVCNFCTELEKYRSNLPSKEYLTKKIDSLFNKIRTKSKQEYNCIVGVSGGVDSSWVLVKVVEAGLKPLVIHLDNGWNTSIATNNVFNLVNKLGLNLHTHVIDWEEYRDIMKSFFKADVVDIELIYDNAVIGLLYRYARNYKIKYIMAGTNKTTEGIKMPQGWNWHKYDKRNILSIHNSNFERQFKKILTVPFIGLFEIIYLTFVRRIKWYSILDLLEYNKVEVLNELENNFEYERYPYKHYESFFTRFYQSFILPRKFNIDKRKVHLSSLIIFGQLTREQAIAQLKEKPYGDEKQLTQDKKYFLKKMNWTEIEFNEYLERAPRSHREFSSDFRFFNITFKFYKLLKKLSRFQIHL